MTKLASIVSIGAVLFAVFILPDRRVSSFNLLAHLDMRPALIRRLPEALNDCETCIDSDRSCAKRVPNKEHCNKPGFLYLKIFCKKSCDSCQECSRPVYEDVPIERILETDSKPLP